jgi:hypothetical protein
MSQLNRRNALTAVASFLVMAMPAVAIAAVGPPDPILAVIEAHRRAWAELGTACDNQAVLENEIPHERRHYDVEDSDDPRWIAQQQVMQDVNDRLADAATAMLDIAPTTIAGVIALLSYATEHVCISGADWPDEYEVPKLETAEPVCGWVKTHGVPWETMLHLHVAKTLASIAV